MPQNACRDDGLRISGLQLPEDAATVADLDASGSLSVCHTTTYRWSLAEALVEYPRAGIGGIGLYRPKIEELDEDEAIERIRNSALTVSSLSWIGGFMGADGSTQAEALFDAAEAIRFAAAIGANTVSVISGGAGSHIVKHARRLLVDALCTLCDESAERSVRLALHPFAGSDVRRHSILTGLDDLLDAISATGRRNLGMVFDVAELGRDPRALGRIAELAPLVHVVRLTGPATRRRSASRTLPDSEFVSAFLDAGFEGPFEITAWSDGEESSADYPALLASCRAEFDRCRLGALAAP